MRGFLISLMALFWAAGAVAQDLPTYSATTINDFADILPQGVEDRLAKDIAAFQADTGIELTVVTIVNRAAYGDETSIEDFATRLFNAWGVGDAARNDGVMVLVSPGDREMRVELGSGWDSQYDRTAKAVIDDYFLPYFRDGDYARGIEAGTLELMRRFSPGYIPDPEAAPPAGGDRNWIMWVLFPAFALFAFGQRLLDQTVRLRRCPRCGRRTLARTRDLIRKATRDKEGQQDVTTTCSNCDYRSTYHRSISYRSSSSSGSFGGGSSSGGGASGRW